MTRKPHSIPALLAATLVAVPILAHPGHRAAAQPGHETPGFHGMLVLGSEQIYASHLPMFTAQHRYQGIWQVTFGAQADQVYRDARAQAANDGVIFTLAPNEDFRLPELTGARESFRADVFVGHFERPGNRKLLDDVTVTVERQVHWHPFLVEHARPERLTYQLFGDGAQAYLAHWISVAPDYDQILQVAPAASGSPLPALAQVVVLDRSDDQALRPGEVVPVLLLEHGGSDTPIRVTATDLTVDSEFYREEGELSFSKLDD